MTAGCVGKSYVGSSKSSMQSCCACKKARKLIRGCCLAQLHRRCHHGVARQARGLPRPLDALPATIAPRPSRQRLMKRCALMRAGREASVRRVENGCEPSQSRGRPSWRHRSMRPHHPTYTRMVYEKRKTMPARLLAMYPLEPDRQKRDQSMDFARRRRRRGPCPSPRSGRRDSRPRLHRDRGRGRPLVPEDEGSWLADGWITRQALGGHRLERVAGASVSGDGIRGGYKKEEERMNETGGRGVGC